MLNTLSVKKTDTHINVDLKPTALNQTTAGEDVDHLHFPDIANSRQIFPHPQYHFHNCNDQIERIVHVHRQEPLNVWPIPKTYITYRTYI